MHPTEEGEGSGGEPVVPRGPEWVDAHVRRPSPRTGPYCRRGSLVSNISDPHPAGDLSPVRIRWITHPHHGQSEQSRSSRHSSGRARSGSDSTTIRGNPTAASEVDLLQQPPGRPEMLSPIVEAVSQIGSSPRPTTVQTPRGSKTVFSTPRGGPGSTHSSGHTRATSNPTCLLDHPSSLVLL